MEDVLLGLELRDGTSFQRINGGIGGDLSDEGGGYHGGGVGGQSWHGL